jgi:YrbI family 3-deoxy-D-manno-octulosonate 8-phosphate phosphatase
MKFFAQNLSKALEHRGLTPEDLAVYVGIDVSDIRKALNAEKCLLPSELLRVSKALSIGLMRLFAENGCAHIAFDCKMIALDVDGVMTDGGMIVNSDGTEAKKFNTKDGMAIKNALKRGVEVGFISSGKNIDLIQYRADMLGVKYVWVGSGEKMSILNEWCKNLNISLSQVAYIGDDLNDMEILENVGLSACPADAVPAVRDVCSQILTRKGGEGCVRELVELIGLMKIE